MKTSIVGLKELRGNIDEYIEGVKNGREFVIVRKSKPVFRILPIESQVMKESNPDGEWETVVDFTKIRRGGVPIKELLLRL